MPIFWLGLLFLLLFASHWRLFPFSGRVFPGYIFPTPTHFYTLDSLLTGNFKIIKDVFGHLFLPSLTLSTIPLAILTKTIRGSLLDVLHQEYIRTAYAKGVGVGKIYPGKTLPEKGKSLQCEANKRRNKSPSQKIGIEIPVNEKILTA